VLERAASRASRRSTSPSNASSRRARPPWLNRGAITEVTAVLRVTTSRLLQIPLQVKDYCPDWALD